MSILVLADMHLEEVVDRLHLVGLGKAIRNACKDADLMIITSDLTDNAVQKWPTALFWLGSLWTAAQTTLPIILRIKNLPV